MIQIKHRLTDAVLFTSETATTVREAVMDAVAAGANLTRANLNGANLDGANLDGANLDGASLYGANLYGASLYGANLDGANLDGASLDGANLNGASLYGANLTRANLYGANLNGANLNGANLTRALNVPAIGSPAPRDPAEDRRRREEWFRARFPDVPVIANLDRQILERIDSGTCSLRMSSWHSCETTHCRAGWAIHLAGEAGYELERKYGPHFAGLQIYRVSTGRMPNFFASDADALEDIRRCAAEDSV